MPDYDDQQLTITINGLSENQKRKLAKLPPERITQTFVNIKNTIAAEAVKLAQSKIALRFKTVSGELFNSIYSVVEGDTIRVSSTSAYFAILNAGYDSFDMKTALYGKKIPMKMPGGAIIYRTVGGPDTPRETKRTKKTASAQWIHPGFSGVHIYEEVGKEMELFVKTYVRLQINVLLQQADNVPNFDNDTNIQYRDSRGRFAKQPQISGSGRFLRKDLLTMNYIKLPSGAIVPKLKGKKRVSNGI